MKQTVKLVSVSLIVLITANGCSSKYSLFGCTTPDVKKQIMDTTNQATSLGASKQCYNNFLLKSKEVDELREANKVCQ